MSHIIYNVVYFWLVHPAEGVATYIEDIAVIDSDNYNFFVNI